MYIRRINSTRTTVCLWSVLAAVAGTAAQPTSADVIILDAQKDNTLIEEPNGSLSNGAGQHFFAGRTLQGAGFDRRRGVIAFDVAGAIPAGSTINSVTLTLWMSRTIAGDVPVSLHRATSDWGEGTSDASGQEGPGAPATAGDATWLHTFYDTALWTTPGGDFSATASASAVVGQIGYYDWSSAEMAAEVQAWLDDPAGNFGWLVIGDESGTETAKRFDSLQNPDPTLRPKLTVDFTPGVIAGACCQGDGNCIVLAAGDCADQGGVYQGDGTSCTPNPCPQPTGACCLDDALCQMLSAADCAAQGGTYRGDDTACVTNPCPPDLEPFVDPLPIPVVAQPASGTAGSAAHYDIAITEFQQQLHRDLPPTTVWGYAGSYPGPTIEARSDQPVTVSWINDLRDASGELRSDHYLPVDLCPHGAEDSAKTVVHLHGAHASWESDGYPEFTFLPGGSDTYYYPNNQLPATLWYHDHALGITRLNVYMGLAGFYLLRDDLEDTLDLPAGEFEIPLVIQDRSFNADGSLFYPAAWQEHFFGSTMLANGKVWPFLEVKQGQYRFRILNGANARTLTLSLSTGLPFEQIGSDGGLLPEPVTVTELTLAPAERADAVIDFSSYAPGTEILLTNSAPAPFPGQPGVGVVPEIMKFVVLGQPGDITPLPQTLRPLEMLQESDAVQQREFVLRKEAEPCAGSVWLINGLGWNDITEDPELGSTEVWRFINRSGMVHPMHMHLVMFQILDRQLFEVVDDEVVPMGDPIPPPPNEAGWKDTVQVAPLEMVRVIARFEDYTGKYAYHCHILEHEDHEMMRQFVLLPPCIGDLDGSGAVDPTDLALMLASWGPNPGSPADLTGDGNVNAADMGLLLGSWGVCPGRCQSATDCDDGLFCNGSESCIDGFCGLGIPPTCDDGDACTTDSCDLAGDACVNDLIDCEDGDACTADSCDPGSGCVNDLIDCDDGDLCTTDSCDPASGCMNDPVDCNDNDACTADSCDPATGGCVNDTINCDDGDACTADSCDPATGCANNLIDCDDGDLCTTDSCDPATGNCINDTIDCDDGDACTADSCDPVTGCVNDVIDCDDGDLCTSDSCDPATGCVNDPVDCNDNDACTTDSCDPATGGCINDAIDCDDGDACTADSCDPATGCANNLIDCDDGDLCTTDSCDPASGCVNDPVDCDDSDACTSDSCDPASGDCINDVIDCDDGDACTDDSCDPASGCVNDVIDCSDGDLCTTDSCDPATGCANDPVDCDDNDACTTDSCDPASGNCLNDAIDCDDGIPCTVDSCDPASGCVNDPVNCAGFVVDTTLDEQDGSCSDGDCSLRDALLLVADGQTIGFDVSVFPPAAAAGIEVNGTQLPPLDDNNVTIDASNAGVIIEDSNNDLGNNVNGLTIAGAGNTVWGLQIISFDAINNSGVRITGSFNTIGGSYNGGAANQLGQGCLLSANSMGLIIEGAGAVSNAVQGCLIGTDLTGTAALGNGDDGILIQGGATSNLIGGNRNDGLGNVLSANGSLGISIAGNGTVNNVIKGNYFGTDVNGLPGLGNSFGGMQIYSGAAAVTIGSTNSGEENLMTSNGAAGITLYGASSDFNNWRGNLIFDNADVAIDIVPTGANDGIDPPAIDSVTTTQVNGSGARPNATVDIYANTDGDSDCLVYLGAATAGAGGNWSLGGLSLTPGEFVVAIQTDPSGNSSEVSSAVLVPFDCVPVDCDDGDACTADSCEPASGICANDPIDCDDGVSCTIDSCDPASGCVNDPVNCTDYVVDTTLDEQDGSCSDGDCSLRDALLLVADGQTIGFNVSVFPPTAAAGIEVDGSPLPPLDNNNVTIDASNAGVIIEDSDSDLGNSAQGLTIAGSGNTMWGLQIINFDGNNNTYGVRITGSFNTLGGSYNAAAANQLGQGCLMSLNEKGVIIEGAGADFNAVQGCLIGTDLTGTAALGNDNQGILIQDGAASNLIGGNRNDGLGNVISANGSVGISIAGSGTVNNVIKGNYVGTDVNGLPGLGNTGGMDVSGGAQAVTIGSIIAGEENLVASNSSTSIEVYGAGSDFNNWRGNLIFDNSGKAIDIIPSSANEGIVAPTIVNVTTSQVDGAEARPNAAVDVYSNTDGDTDCLVYLGAATADAGGNWSLGGLSLTPGEYVVAIHTDTNSNSSEVSVVAGLVPFNCIPVDCDDDNACTADSCEPASGECVNDPIDCDDGVSCTIDSCDPASGCINDPVNCADYLVDTTLDEQDGSCGDGDCSLRDALFLVADGQTIRFDVNVFPPASPATIDVDGTPLPTLNNNNVVIDASSAGVIIEDTDSDLTTGDGLVISGDGNMLMGLQIKNFDRVENTRGLRITGSSNSVGGVYDASADNGLGQGCLFSSNGRGIVIQSPGADFNVIQGCLIGTDLSGTVAAGNLRTGVLISDGASSNILGGDWNQGLGNVVSANATGIAIRDMGSNNNIVEGNSVGTDVSGTLNLGNSANGIRVVEGARFNTIGSLIPGENNRIVFNGSRGIVVNFDSSDFNTWRANLIYDNSGVAIDLAAPDANEGVLPPVIISVTSGQVDGAAGSTALVDVFSNFDGDTDCLTYLGMATADAAGNWTLSGLSLTSGEFVVAIQTDTGGNSSEVSTAMPVP